MNHLDVLPTVPNFTGRRVSLAAGYLLLKARDSLLELWAIDVVAGVTMAIAKSNPGSRQLESRFSIQTNRGRAHLLIIVRLGRLVRLPLPTAQRRSVI